MAVRLVQVLLVLSLAACASQRPPMRVPTEEEARACEARGGSIEPAFALNEYVCLSPNGATP
jgi:hypothetical protein